MRLDTLPLRQPAYVDHIDWDSLASTDSQRLKEFGLCEGASIENLNRAGLFGGGALSCRIGRMTIAMRKSHAHAIFVRTGEDAVAPGHAPHSSSVPA